MRLINNKYIKFKDFIYVLILYLISGNPEIAWQWNYVVIAFLLILLYNKLIFDNSVHYKTCIKFMVVAFIVFIFQFIVFGWNSFPAIINFCSKVFCAYGVAKIIGDKFRATAFYVIYFLCKVGVLLHIVYVFSGFTLDLAGTDFHKSMFIWGHHVVHDEGIIRNDGAFWEPGAFAGYIVMTLMLYIDDFLTLLKKHKTKLIWIFAALITTYSTQGYLLIFVYMFYVLLMTRLRKYLLLLMPVVVCGVMFVSSLDFMGEKIKTQLNATEDVDINGERVDHGRFTSMVFDKYYIEKHPIVGNGLNARTRYADHLYMGDNLIGFGNGLTGFMACMGIPFVLFFLYCVYKNFGYSKFGKYMIPIMLALLLNGEQYQNYPFIFIFMFVNPQASNLEFLNKI